MVRGWHVRLVCYHRQYCHLDAHSQLDNLERAQRHGRDDPNSIPVVPSQRDRQIESPLRGSYGGAYPKVGQDLDSRRRRRSHHRRVHHDHPSHRLRVFGGDNH